MAMTTCKSRMAVIIGCGLTNDSSVRDEPIYGYDKEIWSIDRDEIVSFPVPPSKHPACAWPNSDYSAGNHGVFGCDN